jgi:hypothetical protein
MMETLLYLVIIMLMAGFIQGFSGFGSVLLSLPLLAIFLDVKTAIPLVGADGRHTDRLSPYSPLERSGMAPDMAAFSRGPPRCSHRHLFPEIAEQPTSSYFSGIYPGLLFLI